MEPTLLAESFYASIRSRRRDSETMEEALIRLAGGPHPDAVAGLLSNETAEATHEVITERGRHDADSRKRTSEAFESLEDS